MAAWLDPLLGNREGQPGGDAHHLAHEIDPGDFLGHRMLDLQARIHLQKIEPAVGNEALDRAGTLVAHVSRQGDRRLAHLMAKILADCRRRGLLDDLLKSALERALPLAEMDNASEAIAEHLELDMARRR